MRPKRILCGNLHRHCTLQYSCTDEHTPTVQKQNRSI